MSVIPSNRDRMIRFYEAHEPVWAAAAPQIGLTAAQSAEFSQRVFQAAASRSAALAARQHAQALTLQLNADAAALRTYGAALMATIRGYAEQQAAPETVLVAAEIPAIRPPTPPPPPAPPTSLRAAPNAAGTITLTWKGTISHNQSFLVERSLDGGPFGPATSVRRKRFLDAAVPMGTRTVTYRVWGVRDEARSQPATAQVRFGNLPGAMRAAFRSEEGTRGAAAKAA